MATITKNELLKAKIDELVTKTGSPIGGEGSDDTYNTTSQISANVGAKPDGSGDSGKSGTGKPATTMDAAVKQRQGPRQNLAGRGAVGGVPDAISPKIDADMEDPDAIGFYNENVDDIAKDKMAKMVEDIVNRSLGTDMVKKPTNSGVQPPSSNTPDGSQLKGVNPTCTNAALDFSRAIAGQPPSANEKQIILNYITNILNQYK